MQPLATAADMADRDIAPTRYTAASLASASAAVREAAGVPISTTTATVVVPGTYGSYLDLPGPVTTATSVTIDGTPVTDYNVWPTSLCRSSGWGSPASQVSATITTGTTVPDDIVQLVCELAVLIAASDGDNPRIASESIDDAQVTYRDDGTTSAVELPEGTRLRLRARFGGSPVAGVR